MTRTTATRVIAIDWSGAAAGAEKRIWRADVLDGALVYLRNGSTADDIAEQLIALAAADPRIVIGLDFAFSMPAWFLRQQGLTTAQDLWAHAAQGLCEPWLRQPPYPFWGRPGSTMPRDCDLYRRTERDLHAATGFHPKSVFQLAGAGAVGTASLRGMPVLDRLHHAGFHVWPYDDPGWPLVLEIYPRVFTGPVRKSNTADRELLVRSRYPQLDEHLLAAMISSEDAFDAAISALEMTRHLDALCALPHAPGALARLEGIVWFPGCTSAVPADTLNQPASTIVS